MKVWDYTVTGTTVWEFPAEIDYHFSKTLAICSPTLRLRVLRLKQDWL